MQLTLSQARRIALAAQGFGRPRPNAVTMRQFQAVIHRLGVFQIDSVNVLARAHLLPMFARVGAYDVDLFRRAASGRPPRLVEYWAHEAALVPPATWHLMGYRMERHRTSSRWGTFLHQNRPLVDSVLDHVADEGPLTARQAHEALGHDRGPKVRWGWNWTASKRALEALFATGQLAVARRNAQFERLYDLPERVLGPLPDEALAPEDAALELVRIAARATGIATLGCLADYFRMRRDSTARAVERLVALGELEPVTVRGWDRPVWLHTEAARPRRIRARALLAPFDPLVWERRRLLELFGMHYRIGIYTPAAQREHGYYVLPFLLDEALVGRVDLKADRKTGVLRALQVTWEPDAPPHARQELAAEMHVMAQWLGLGDVELPGGHRRG